MPKTGVLSYLLAFFLDTELKNIQGRIFLNVLANLKNVFQVRLSASYVKLFLVIHILNVPHHSAGSRLQ